jgi:hypothetical protein
MVLALLFAQPVVSIDSPFSPESVREAYFFGQSSDRGKVGKFLDQYRRTFTLTEKLTSVGTIEILTPFQQVVRRSFLKPMGYSAQQAQRDYGEIGDAVRVRVYITFNNHNPDPAQLYSDREGHVMDHRENFWHDYRFHVTEMKEIQPNEIKATSKYGCCGEGLMGVIVDLEFPADKLPQTEIHVEVIAPDGQATDAHFELNRLR